MLYIPQAFRLGRAVGELCRSDKREIDKSVKIRLFQLVICRLVTTC